MFSWPGIGLLLVSAIGSADVDLVMIIVVFFAVLAVVFNLLADLAYGWLDPRIRYG
ncbi:MAG: ABC transporter permease subunit [Actinomycetota bacterium]